MKGFRVGMLAGLALLGGAGLGYAAAQAVAPQTEMPRLVEQGGRHALLVDGKPYLVLGAQIHNSSSFPAVLPSVWPTLEGMHVNTMEAPVYWETLEPTQGAFDFSTVDTLLAGARAHHLHLVLLWFGTWKNGNMHYAPEWVKANPAKYPRVINANGEPIDVLSAGSRANLEADKSAFRALMHHLAQVDGAEHTTILVQVENESGIVGSPRDYSAESNRMFDGAVPAELVKALAKKPGTWRDVFGGHAEETFQAYQQSRYINEIAEAGKREMNLPMYCNVWLTYPVAELPERQVPNPGIGYPSGGPVQGMLGLWKRFAPAIDMIGPDIYSSDPLFYESVLDTYARPDNALWIPETGHEEGYQPYLFLALGKGAIGFSPFGADPYKLFEDEKAEPLVLPYAASFGLLAPMAREIAALNYAGKVKTAVELVGGANQEFAFGAGPQQWVVEVRFGHASDGVRVKGNADHNGVALVAETGPDEFLVTGLEASVRFHVADRMPGLRSQILSAEEGMYKDGVWVALRRLNGDETDRGLNFGAHATTAVKVKVGRF